MEKQNQPSLSFLSHQKGWIVLVLICLVVTQFVEYNHLPKEFMQGSITFEQEENTIDTATNHREITTRETSPLSTSTAKLVTKHPLSIQDEPNEPHEKEEESSMGDTQGKSNSEETQQSKTTIIDPKDFKNRSSHNPDTSIETPKTKERERNKEETNQATSYHITDPKSIHNQSSVSNYLHINNTVNTTVKQQLCI